MKKILLRIIPLLAVLLVVSDAFGQLLYFDGAGRAVVANDRLKGDLIKGDTISPNRGTSGYTLIDFGVNIKPTENFKARIELRARNNFGQFFGAGTSVNLRQIQIEGNIRKRLYYALGDIDVKMTPFTVFNNYEQYHRYEAEIFTLRRNIVQYENFNSGNNWRMQGVKAFSDLALDSLDLVRFSAFATRTRVSNNTDIPDRFLVGISGNFVRNKSIVIGANYVGLLDNSPTNYNVNYANNVYTTNYRVALTKEKLVLAIQGESGISSYRNENKNKDTVVTYQDYFVEAGAEANWIPRTLKFSLGYRNVGPQFSSPAAQTQRIAPTAVPDLFPNVQNGVTSRGQLLSDRYTQERMYNQAINPLLFQVLPIYSLVLPYGVATPNRQGLFLILTKASSKQIYEAEVEVNSLSEIVGEGTDKLRKYLLVKGGLQFNVDKLVNVNRNLVISLGAKQESSNRDGLSPIKLETQLIDAGLRIETLKDLELLAGLKYLTASGNEYLLTRDDYNTAVGYTEVNYKITQNVIALGLKYSFTKNSHFTVHFNKSSLKDILSTTSSYEMNQLFLNYSVKF